MRFYTVALFAACFSQSNAVGFRTVGSSGCAAQMLFVPPFTDNVVFLDNYHPNYGGPGVDLKTGRHSEDAYKTDDGYWVMATEYNWKTNKLRKLSPKSNTFCSAGSFLADGTMLNLAGSEPDEWQANIGKNVMEGFDKIRTYAPGPCQGDCAQDIIEHKNTLQAKRWYPSTSTLLNGDVLVVGGSNVGLLVINEASVNVPTYEIVKSDLSADKKPVTLPYLEFSDKENLNFNKSFNLYPILVPLPNSRQADEIFTIVGNRAFIWDYTKDKLVSELPDTPLQPRNFPSSASVALLPLKAPDFIPTVLLCGGSSTDVPDPQALDDCYTINPGDEAPKWEQTDNMPNGGQTMTDAILLPDGKVLLINGAHKGSAGGWMADDPVFTPLVYDHSAAPGRRFTAMPKTDIPRLYHSVATLLPSGEVIIAGSNPDVFYNNVGRVLDSYPYFNNNGHRAVLEQQQEKTSLHPTEYRVEVFSPTYMDVKSRPVIKQGPEDNVIKYNETFQVALEAVDGQTIAARLINPGFRTHAVGMDHRSVELQVRKGDNNQLSVTAPRDATVIVAGIYMLFVDVDGVPSEAIWVKLS
ncbi:glyoxal oxidase [Fusarium denticulatum]|uniref:Glyoxal oxidase n=1 Tax=Fusarium denticulatum TaxID=48507 RepID=A0A8H5X8B3_9HYPO|nr:glyoxal oxidase [Fusarium denticulatum]